ncbi:MAG: peptide chain release factor aRF-1 [Nanoarchaeota archaeon]
MSDIKRKKLKELLAELGNMRGRHTELVTVYVPAGFSLDKVASQIKSEQSTAINIKSKPVRKNVMSALEKILQHMKLYKSTPENGLAMFCGNVSDKEGVADIEIWAVEPPEPLNTRLYRCDQVFILGPLETLLEEKELYGLIVLDKSEATIGLLKGKRIEVMKHMESIVPGKTKKGGWSQARYQRIREGLLHDFMKLVGDIASEKYKSLVLKGIIIGGPGPIKDMFAEGGFLAYNLRDKVIGVVDVSYSNEYGLREVLEKGEDILSEASVMREKKILDRFFSEFSKDSGLAIYGFSEVVKALEEGNLELLLLSEAFDWVKVSYQCNCGFKVDKPLSREQIDMQKCPNCDAALEIVSEKDITDDVLKKAEEMSTNIEIISIETEKGQQLKEIGGIAGILRYRT